MIYFSLSVLILVIVLFLVFDLRKTAKKISKKEINQSNRDLWILSLGVFAGIFILILLFIVYGEKYFNQNTGWIGDTVGGITAPFINGLAAILVYRALKEQVLANELVRRQIDIQELENKFFEMIKMHRENVSELSFSTRDFNDFIYRDMPETYNNKEVFVAIYKQFTECWNEIGPFFKNAWPIYNRNYLNELQNKLPHYTENEFKRMARIDICYSIVFYGLEPEGQVILKRNLTKKYNVGKIELFINFLALKPLDNRNIFEKWKLLARRDSIQTKKEIIQCIYAWRSTRDIPHEGPHSEIVNGYLNHFSKYYCGHQFRMGHYYRHFFGVVTYINSNRQLEYSKKYAYVKMLRSQLSTHEQILLFLNSVSNLGHKWELIPKKEFIEGYTDWDFKLITKYNLIKNIPNERLFEIPVTQFYPLVQFEGGTKKLERPEFH